ncbi:MAG: universal stress protein, partial [Chloroflexi bacterium]|nr:universal stress protein [Chloroflexota bacterium]
MRRPTFSLGDEMFGKVLVPLDGSKLAEEVLPYAVDLALRCQSRVVLMQVIPVAGSVPDAGHTGVTASTAERELRLEEERAQTYLDWTAKALRQRGVEVEGVLRRGLPAREIV